ncbi:hypothetical protein ACU4GD_09070 [Cupriavidus basilensis]
MICFGLLFTRFLWLQWYKHDQYSAKAEDNRISVAPIEPNRGIIMDRATAWCWRATIPPTRWKSRRPSCPTRSTTPSRNWPS